LSVQVQSLQVHANRLVIKCAIIMEVELACTLFMAGNLEGWIKMRL